MSTRERRSRPILLSGGLLLAAVATASACSSASEQAAGGTATSSAVIQSSSAPSAPAPASATSPAGPASSGSAPKPAPSAGTSAHATTPSAAPQAAAAPVAVNGRSVPSCDPAQFARRAGTARGALQTYFFGPYAAGALRGSGAKPALALLHAGQAVRFATQELVAAKGLLATCPRPVGGVVNAVADEVSTLRDLWPVFGANHAPDSAAVSGARAAQTALTRAALAGRMPLVTVVPTAVQIQTGN